MRGLKKKSTGRRPSKKPSSFTVSVDGMSLTPVGTSELLSELSLEPDPRMKWLSSTLLDLCLLKTTGIISDFTVDIPMSVPRKTNSRGKQRKS